MNRRMRVCRIEQERERWMEVCEAPETGEYRKLKRLYEEACLKAALEGRVGRVASKPS